MRIDDKLIYEYSKSLNILYVESDEQTRLDVAPYLSEFFKQVDNAFDGEKALEKYKSYQNKTGKTYDIVIANIELPLLDGLELGWKITKINPWQDIIFTSSYNEAIKLKKAIQMGARGFLDKPVSYEHLRGIVFKISKSVYDTKFAEQYYQNIEAINIELENKNKELQKMNKVFEAMLSNRVKKEQLNYKSETVNDENNDLFKNEIKNLVNIDLDELLETQEEIDLNISKCKINPNNENISLLAQKFKHYGDILSSYTFFNDVSKAFEFLYITMDSEPLSSDQKNVEHIFIFLESFMYVLSKWQSALVKLSPRVIQHFDASIVSELDMICKRWNQESIDDGEYDFFK